MNNQTPSNLRLRTMTVTLKHTESKTQEEQAITVQFDDYTDQFTLVKVFVLELRREVLFDKEANEILLPD